MHKQPLDDGTWFDLDQAQKFEEDTWWNGNNHISKATGTQFDHEVLYKTAKGAWVKHCHSQWQGTGESWATISEDEAKKWLIKNGYPSALSDKEVAELEV